MLDAYLYHGVRTPFGRYAGKLSGIRVDDLMGHAIRELVAHTKLDPKTIDDVIIGCANQAGEDSRCVARHAVLSADLPIDVPGQVIQRNCGSGMNALASAAQAVTCGEGSVMIAGGVEGMSRAPFVMPKADTAFSRDARIFDSTIGARFSNPKIVETFGNDTMPETADNLARDYQITREQADVFASESQRKYAAAKDAGFFAGEIAPIAVPGGKAGPVMVADDEHPRADTALDKLAKLRPLNRDGVTTAGNASGVNDGAAALLVSNRAFAEKSGLAPITRIRASAVAGVAPRIMGIGPAPAARKALERAGLKLSDMDVIEVNEAFAAQVLACLKDLGIAFDDHRVNPNGGAIAVGHPLGASGA
ncbi:MAG: acetyl-CoA C-acyltransferase, partial [Alphaproteobacteria bacterium]|nr:acetyl-CoA C-acyltransferase [Alphaproteobacteria bacterium]